jgi:HAD superfamily phosphatase (TIGR01668 family)
MSAQGMTSPVTMSVASLYHFDFRILSARGVRGLLLDVDNTLVAPLTPSMDPALAAHLRREISRANITSVALASNSHRDLTPIAVALGASVVKAQWLVAKPRRRYFERALAALSLPASQVAMVGDKMRHDIDPARQLGMHTLLVDPLARDQTTDRLLLRRFRERHARTAVELAGRVTPRSSDLRQLSGYSPPQYPFNSP